MCGLADSMTVISFLKTFGLEPHFKVHIYHKLVIIYGRCHKFSDWHLRTIMECCLQCFDTVGWAAGRASGP